MDNQECIQWQTQIGDLMADYFWAIYERTPAAERRATLDAAFNDLCGEAEKLVEYGYGDIQMQLDSDEEDAA